MLLAIDTSTSLIGAAVHDGSAVLAEVVHEDARRHTELLAPAVRSVLVAAGVGRHDLTALAVGVGPGPFTGLRVGVVTALVMGHTLGIAVHGVCSLDALAAEAAPWVVDEGGAELLVTTDARRKEVYWARYAVSAAGAHRVQGPQVARAVDLPEGLRSLPTVGRGPGLYPQVLHGIPAVAGARAVLDVRPGVLAGLAAGALADGDPAGVLLPPSPLYLRRPDAVTAAARVSAGAAAGPRGPGR